MAAQKRVLHLSDIHFDPTVTERAVTYAELVGTLEALSQEKDWIAIDAIVVTGDVFDSADGSVAIALEHFVAFYRSIQRVAGRVPWFIIPGNHDVRTAGVKAWRGETPFEKLGDALSGEPVTVFGGKPPFLAARVEPSRHGLPAELLLLDSTHLPRGWLSAGGVVRPDDLLALGQQLDDGDTPVVALIHHHLVPTPITDVSEIQLPLSPPLARGAAFLLGALVANLDREETMMTALGAGTALTLLHSFGRAIVVLHGHKHYPTVRLLKGVFEGHGDVLIISAGSAGVEEAWRGAAYDKAAQLWPSFNLLDLGPTTLTADTVAFSPKPKPDGARWIRRTMVTAEREGAVWLLRNAPAAAPMRDAGPRLSRNVARFSLTDTTRVCWSADVERDVAGDAESAPEKYFEAIEGRKGALVTGIVRDGKSMPDCPSGEPIEIATNGVTRYRLVDGISGTFRQATHDYGVTTEPYEWVGLLNRYDSAFAELTLSGLPPDRMGVFGSVLDLSTGAIRSARPERSEGGHRIRLHDCPALTLLRIHWPLRD